MNINQVPNQDPKDNINYGTNPDPTNQPPQPKESSLSPQDIQGSGSFTAPQAVGTSFFSFKIIMIFVASLTLLGGISFGVYNFFIKDKTGQISGNQSQESSATENGKTNEIGVTKRGGPWEFTLAAVAPDEDTDVYLAPGKVATEFTLAVRNTDSQAREADWAVFFQTDSGVSTASPNDGQWIPSGELRPGESWQGSFTYTHPASDTSGELRLEVYGAGIDASPTHEVTFEFPFKR